MPCETKVNLKNEAEQQATGLPDGDESAGRGRTERESTAKALQR